MRFVLLVANGLVNINLLYKHSPLWYNDMREHIDGRCVIREAGGYSGGG